jgi:cobyrinic acid a,c-diamide synthase
VIINKIAGPRHEGKLVAAVERYCDVPVLGTLRRDDAIAVRERHLGLTTPTETGAVEARIARIADAILDGVDLDKVLAAAATAVPLVASTAAVTRHVTPHAGPRVRIAVARDTAFGFYYADDLEALEAAGAELRFFDSMADRSLPDADGLLIGGGFPETQLAALEANGPLRAEIKARIEAGMPTYAECGGLMYLCRTIAFGSERREMVGVVPGDAVMCAKPQGRGQVRLAETTSAPWPTIDGAGGQGWNVNAHEFHFAAVRNLPSDLDYAFKVVRGDGIDQRRDGVVIGNLLATFSHQRDTSRNPWTRRFVAFVRACKAARPASVRMERDTAYSARAAGSA